jgi:hypothetical protein
MRFQYYANNAEKPEPLGYITLDKFINSIKAPKESTQLLLEQIAQASADNDMKRKAELKRGLYAFTPCVNLKGGRGYKDIISFTGLTVLDFDGIDYAYEFKQFLFETYSSIIAAWVSPSKRGVKALVKIPVVGTIEEYKEYFYGLASEMQVYKGFDDSNKNAVLILFIGYDPNILIRTDYTTWDIKGSQINDFDKAQIIPIPDIKPTSAQSQWVVDSFCKTVNGINNEAHPQIRNASVALGGYVASNYLGYYEAVNLAKSLISQNAYMQKGISGYQKTAVQSINIGLTRPLTFSK